MPLSRTRGFGLRPCCPAATTSHLLRAACLIREGRRSTAEQRLANYYQEGFPLSAADVLGLHRGHAAANYPPLAAVLPWFGMTPGDYLVAMETGIRGYALQNNHADWGVTDGHTQFGPASRRKICHEVVRLEDLLASVQQSGISEDYPPVLGCLLTDDRGEGGQPWVFDVRDGLHRCAVYAALGYETVEMKLVANLGPEVRRSQSAEWAQVRSGLFTEDEALTLFDRYVDGRL